MWLKTLLDNDSYKIGGGVVGVYHVGDMVSERKEVLLAE
jgi:hypothetical protein